MTGEEEILNTGLKLALEFGSDWLKPIQSRLSEKFPKLTEDELNRYDTICRSAMKQGHQFIQKKLEAAAKKKKKPTANDLIDDLRTFLHKENPWIDESNISSILSQGFYYAWKDGFF